MNIKQLMIGDWVFNRHHNQPIQLTAYDYFTHSHKDGVQSFESVLNPRPTMGRDLEPIPLTEDILKTNSWSLRYKSPMVLSKWEILNDDKPLAECAFYKKKDYVILWIFTKRPIDLDIHYVHELQHALRLCGLNELADNFKINE